MHIHLLSSAKIKGAGCARPDEKQGEDRQQNSMIEVAFSMTHGKLAYRAGCKSAIKPGPVGFHPNACFVFVLDAWKSALTK
jgi:hypothetical protein